MKNNLLILSLFLFNIFIIYSQETVTISGRVTDFEGKPIDSCYIALSNTTFEGLYKTYTDKNGYYSLNNVKKGTYQSFVALKEKEYPRANAVPEEDMRLEFWAWNVIADRDLIINPKYQKLELYGTTAFEIFGGYPGLFIYFRPMSLTKYMSFGKQDYLDKNIMDKKCPDISVDPKYLDLKIYADDELLKINSIQTIDEFAEDSCYMKAYLVQVDRPKTKTDKPYRIIKVEAENKEYNEFGENLYFYRIPKFENPSK